MAGTLTVLYFDDTDDNSSNWKWVELKNRAVNPSYNDSNPISNSNLPYAYTGGSPVISCEITDEIGLPLECNLVLNNSQIVKKPYEIDTNHPSEFGSKPLANGQVSQYNGLLPELTRLIIHDSSTFMTLFIGRVYRSEEPFLPNLGTALKLQCFDALRELVGVSTRNLSDEDLAYTVRAFGELNVDGSSSSGTVANGPGNYPTTTTISRNLDHIKDLILKSTYGTSSTQSITYVDHKVANGNIAYPSAFTTQKANADRTGTYTRNKTDILKVIQSYAQNEEWYTSASLNGVGFEYFLDATRATPIHSLATVPQQDFNYFRKGLYYTATPATYGLTSKYATYTNVNDNQSSSNDLVRNMFNDFNFAGFADDTITHLSLVHYPREELEGNTVLPMTGEINARRMDVNEREVAVRALGKTSDKWSGVKPEKMDHKMTETFTIIYVTPSSGDTVPDFRWAQDRIPTNSSSSQPYGDQDVRTFRQVTSLHKTAGGGFTQTSNSGAHQEAANTAAQAFFRSDLNTKTWLGNVQYQGKNSEGTDYLILSHPQEDVLATLTENDTLYERGWASQLDNAHDDNTNYSAPTYVTCRFKSYPAADKGIRKYGYYDGSEEEMGGNEYYGWLRRNIGERLAGGNNRENRMRNGQFRIKDWPHVRWTGTTQSGVDGNSFKPVVASLKSPLDYGMRRGCSVVKRNSNGFWAGYVTDINTSTDAVTAPLFEVVDLGTSAETTPAGAGGWAVGDTYNVYVPYRTGMAIRVDNSMAVTVGDHLIVSIRYTWDNGHVSSEVATVGINDKIMYKTAKKLHSQEVPSLTEAEERSVPDPKTLAANAYEARGVVWWHNHAYGATPSLAAGNLRDYNSFSWSGGLVKVHSTNKSYKINPGNTDAALTASGYTVTGGTWGDGTQNNPMQPNKQYVLYLDTLHGEKDDGTYDIYCLELTHGDDGYVYSPGFINMAYITTGKNESAGSKEIKGTFNPDGSLYTVNIPFDGSGSNGMGMVNIQFMNTFTNVLGVDNQVIEASRIIQPNSLTSTLLSKGSRAFTSNLSIRPRNNLYNQVLWDGDGSGGAATLTFADDDVVTIAAGNTTSGFSNNTTNYMYLDGTSAGLTGTLTPQFTTAHGTATGDSKVLLALIVVGADATQKSPTILPLNSKVPTFNATAIAADAIIATHVQAGSIDTAKLTTSAQNSITEKAITHVGNSAPSNPRNNDIWFDTSVNPTVIKVYDTSLNPDAWVERNSNAPAGSGIQTFSSVLTSVPSTTGQKDLWLTSDTHQLFIAMHGSGGTSNEITSGEWTPKDDAEAINSGTTTIEGGLIRTNRIKLLSGKQLTSGSTSDYKNAFESTIIGVSNTNRETNGAIDATVGTVAIDAYAGGDLRIYAGDVLLIESEKMYVTGGSDTSLTVVRGWSGTTAATHADNTDIFKLAYSVDGYANPHIIMDNYGITGYSNEFTQEFSLHAETGKGSFGGGVGTLSSAGLIIDQTVAGDNNGRIIIKSAAGEHGIAVVRSDNGYPAGTLNFGVGIGHKQVSFNMSDTNSNDPRFLFGTKAYKVTLGNDGTSGATSYAGVRGLYFTSRTGDGNLPDAPVAKGAGVLYTKADGKLYFRARTNANSLLAEVDLTSGVITAGNGITVSGSTVSLDTSYGATWSDTQYYNGANHYINNSLTVNGTTNLNGGMNFGNSSADTITFYGKVAAGTFGSPAIQFTSSGDNGLFSETDGSYQRIKWKGSGGTNNFPGFSHDGTWGYCFANAGNFGTCYVTGDVIASVGSASDPTYTFTGYTTSGMYYSSAGVEISRSSSRIATFGSAGVYFYGGNVYIDDLPSTSSATNLRKGTDDFLYIVTSTLKSKMNVRDLEIDSSNVYTLEPKTFDMRNQYRDTNNRWAYGDTPTNTDFGMIAEEVYTILPELVNLDKEGEPQSINYDMLSVLLLAEIKKLNARIEVLEGN